MAHVNNVTFGGNLVRDPKHIVTSGEMDLCKLTIANNHKWGGKETATFMDVTFFGKQAKVIFDHFEKGKPIVVAGRLAQENWEGKDGTKRSKIAIVGERFWFAGGGPQGRPKEGFQTSADAKPKQQINMEGQDVNDIPF